MQTKTSTTKLLVTPEMAKLFLQKVSPNNRPVNYKKVDRYMKQMLANKFDYKDSISDIEFDQQGFLVNGQHRLRAIVRSKKPLKLRISYHA